MTEYELLDASGTMYELGAGSMSGYFTVFVSYLVAAYFIGAKLSRPHVVIINGLFLMMEFFMIWAAIGFLARARELSDMIREPYFSLKPHQIALPLMSLGVLACLKFMWDIRHQKSD